MSRTIVRLIFAILPAVLLAELLITAAQSQGPSHGPSHGMDQEMAEKTANRQTTMMKTELNLTPDQAQKVSQINMTEVRGFQQVFGKYKGSGDKRGMVKQALAVNKAREMQLQKVLTPQQRQMRQANKPERTARMMTRMMTLQLNLTDQQIPEVEQINLTAAREMQSELGSAGNLRGKSLRETLRTVGDIKSAMKERDQSLQKVLTPEQWMTYQESHEEMKEIMGEKLRERMRQ